MFCRIAPFQDKCLDYQLQFIALKWRDHFQRKFKSSLLAKPRRSVSNYEDFLSLLGEEEKNTGKVRKDYKSSDAQGSFLSISPSPLSCF